MTESLSVDSAYNTNLYQKMIDEGLVALPTRNKVINPLFGFVNRERPIPRK
jgi:hypothetical protein